MILQMEALGSGCLMQGDFNLIGLESVLEKEIHDNKSKCFFPLFSVSIKAHWLLAAFKSVLRSNTVSETFVDFSVTEIHNLLDVIEWEGLMSCNTPDD